MKNVLKKIYNSLPYKHPVFERMRRFVPLPERVYRHLHFHGDFAVKIDNDASFKLRHYGFQIENEIFWAGLTNGWEKTSTSLWIKLVKSATVIFDIGANTGVYSLIAKSLNPKSHVFAFEPIRRVYEKLEANVLLNEFDISCIESAVSNSDGTATVFDLPTEHIYSVTVNKNLNSSDANVIPTQIKTVRLDTFFREMGLNRLDLLKIDVETHEPEVIQGMGKLLSEFQPTMLIEILNDDVARKVQKLIEQTKYLYFNIDEKSNSVRQVETLTKSDYYNYLVCSRETALDLNLLK